MTLDLKVILQQCEEGGFTAYIPAFPGCVSQGETEEEALNNITEALSLWLETQESLMVEEDESPKVVRQLNLAIN